jgi:putative phage-type endonuclease
MKKIIVGTPEWEEARKEYITATDLPIIMGVSKWKSVDDLYLEKIGKIVPFKNHAMRRGLDLEPEARKIFENRFATLVDPQFVVSEKVSWAAASLDGWDNEEMLVEIKCPGQPDHNVALEGKVPRHYYPQLQWQMMVTDQPYMYYFSYRPECTSPIATIKVPRDEEYIQDMLVKAEGFYLSVKNRIPPGEPNNAASELLLQLDDEFALSLEIELFRLLEKRKEDDERIEYIKQELLKLCKGQKSKGRFLAFTPVDTKGSIQYERIPQLEGVNLEIYRKPGFVKWRIDQLDKNH